MKSKKTILFDEDGDALYEFSLIGISCHLKGYRLAWGLNKKLSISLEKNKNGVKIPSAGKISEHNLFTFVTENGTVFSLIKNRSDIYLSKELSHADFFLKIEGEVEREEDLINDIKATKGVLAVFQLNVDELKAKDNFIF